MNFILIFFILDILISINLSGQKFRRVAVTDSGAGSRRMLEGYVAKFDEYSAASFTLYENNYFSFVISIQNNLKVSDGEYRFHGDTLVLKSYYPEKKMPIKLMVREREIGDSNIRNFDIIEDLAGHQYPNSAININQDSVQCFYGDMECFGSSIKSIDSIKVVIGTGISSGWLKVSPTKKIMRIQLQTEIPMDRYFAMRLRLVRREGGFDEVYE
ncbi:hypothetical protein [Pollutibacter soli]|uniref:hypothetical protein n=1 Tax=Pollutibacter soli TaxID=3034157 RepID=UPI003014106D